MSLATYMFVDSYVHKRTYTRTLGIHCLMSPAVVSSEAGAGHTTDWLYGKLQFDRDLVYAKSYLERKGRLISTFVKQA
jgi:hypothetical protein